MFALKTLVRPFVQASQPSFRRSFASIPNVNEQVGKLAIGKLNHVAIAVTNLEEVLSLSHAI